jgi:aminopeptidase N
MRRFLVQATALLGVAFAAPAGAAPHAAGWPPAHFVDGAPGAGDPYFELAGNGGYDVEHYLLDLSYDPASRHLEGTAVILAVATQNLARFDLDLREPMRVRSLAVDGVPARVARAAGQELVVTPRIRPRAGLPFVVTVHYGGTPQPVTDPDGSVEGWLATDDGAFVADEPQGTSSWFPCSDHPSDKATATVRMTVPDGITAVGNGTLVSKSTHDGRTTFVWNESRPMATYLATITTGRFLVSRSRTPDGIPVYLAVDPREARQAQPTLDRLPEVVAFEQSVFGRYPFETVGAIVDSARFLNYSLETQTRPLFDRAPSLTVLVHEMAHQWFGDSVSLRRWRDIWLNEGFATYAEWLWSEHDGGPTPQEIFGRLYATPASDTRLWNPPSGNPGGPAHLFATSVYQRGAMTLQALRGEVGDRVFFRLLRDWARLHRLGSATTRDFVALAERESGRDLRHFFDVWLFQEGKPTAW